MHFLIFSFQTATSSEVTSLINSIASKRRDANLDGSESMPEHVQRTARKRNRQRSLEPAETPSESDRFNMTQLKKPKVAAKSKVILLEFEPGLVETKNLI